MADIAKRVKEFLQVPQIRAVGNPERKIERVAVGCGSAATFMAAAKNKRMYYKLLSATFRRVEDLDFSRPLW